ncbi:MAG: hypothetical protein Q9217_002834 [Psora testacea]
MWVRSVSFFLLPYITILLCPKVRCTLFHKRNTQCANDSTDASIQNDLLPAPLLISPNPPPPAASTQPPPLISNGVIVSPFHVPTSSEVRPPVEVSENAGPVSFSVIESPAAAITPPPAVPGIFSSLQPGAQPGYGKDQKDDPAIPSSLPYTSNIPPVPQFIPTKFRSASPSGLAVFSSIKASDGCQQIGSDFVTYTATFGPGQLSSIRDSSTYSFNFADLPCPPASVHWTKSGAYAPIVAPPPWLFGLDPEWSTCIPGAGQGIDPFTALKSTDSPSPAEPSDGKGHHHHPRAAHAHRHMVPWAAARTTEAAQ